MDALSIDPPPKHILNVSGSCFEYVSVFSSGMWNLKNGESILQYSLFRFNMQLILYVSVTSFFHFFLKRLYIPRTSSEILAGIVLGPTLLETQFPNASNLVFSTTVPNVIMAAFAKLGYLIFAFLAGVRMDPSLILRTGYKTPILGVLLALFPFLMELTLKIDYNKELPRPFSAMLARTQTYLTYFSMIIFGQFIGASHILLQLKITNSRVGHLALASQLITELLRFIFVVAGGFKIIYTNIKFITAIHSFLLCLLFTLVLFLGLRPLIHYFIRKTPEDGSVVKSYTIFIVLVVLASAIFSELVGVFYMYGPFLVGLLVPAGSPLAQDVISKLESITSGIFIPIMVTFCASKFNLWWFLGDEPLIFYITVIGYMLKLLVTFILAICCKLTKRDAAALTLILNNKGVLEIGTFLNFGNLELRDVDSTWGMLFVLIFSAIIPPIVKLIYDPSTQYIGHNKKSIQLSAPDAELSILACAYKQEDAMAAIKLLEFSNPTKESPLNIFGLCLEELVASSTPVLVNHQLGQKTTSAFGSRSQPTIDIFKYYQHQNRRLTQVHIYTAISHLRQMHEDICCLAFNKATSLIILPFHNKWNSKYKKLIPGSKELRDLNIDVLNRAPCSVAILIDRRGSQGLSSIFVASNTYRVGLVFVGGDDDREALAYALRMAGNFRVQLTVVRLTSGEKNWQNWETMLDEESLRTMTLKMASCENIFYREEIVNDGSRTTSIVQEMEGSFDLIMVGRRHENNEFDALSGLSEWTDLPELGTLGDMLASPDIQEPVSVLVVQQQITQASHSSVLVR